MTGESRDIDDPSFSYDTTGTGCLDTLSDFIDQNNPDRLSAKISRIVTGKIFLEWNSSAGLPRSAP
jgi:hypothetical protein